MMKEIMTVGVLVLCAGAFLQWSRKAVVLTEYRYESDRIPDGFDGFRIVQVSDLQSESFGREQKHILGTVRKAEPDIIVVTGDLVDRNHTDYEVSIQCIRGLQQIAQVYYVNGNHELALPVEAVQVMYHKMEEYGVSLLFDRCIRIFPSGEKAGFCESEPVYLAGLSEETILQSKISGGVIREPEINGRRRVSDTEINGSVITDAVAAAVTCCRDDFLILLAHEPQFAQTYARTGADLVFAGHAHGGQIRLPLTDGLFAPGQGFLPKMTSGIRKIGSTAVIISRGLGNSTFPFRLFNRPEIVTVELHRKR